jgi:hypothetical protein
MSKLTFLAALVLTGVSLQAGYVGSYEVDGGPGFAGNPATYTPQEAAAFIFGGVASDYSISTASDVVDPTTITHTGWESVWGVAGGTEYAENAKTNTFYNCGATGCAASAYVTDHAQGAAFTNYVWHAGSVATPEPSTLVLTGSFVGLALARVRRRRKA